MMFNAASTTILAALVASALAAPSDSVLVSSPGYTVEPAKIVFEKATDMCSNYNPEGINWNAARSDILAYLSQPENLLIGPEQVPYKRVAAMLVRSAFHDAGAFQQGVGGADGSIVLNFNEQFIAANGAPLKFVPYARAALDPIAEKYQMSYADAIAFAGAVAAQFLGQTNGTYTLKVGRCDTNVQNPDVLPKDNLTYREFVDYWDSVGIEIQDAAALMGSHTIVQDGQSYSDGVQQYQWSNQFFKDSTTGNITVVDGTQVQWTNGAENKTWHYTINDANDAPQNVNKCPFARMYKTLINDFALDPATWEASYSSAYARLTDIGATWSDYASVIDV